jgi:hypothetical protein
MLIITSNSKITIERVIDQMVILKTTSFFYGYLMYS